MIPVNLEWQSVISKNGGFRLESRSLALKVSEMKQEQTPKHVSVMLSWREC